MFRRTILGLLLTVCCAWASAAVEVVTDAKNGDSIHGDYALRATVRSDNLVTKVELYVGGQLKDSKTSTPYTFQIDTLAENDGPFSVKLVAYTSEGDKGEKTLDLVIDNELSKGAAYHIGKGEDALTVKNWADAVTHGRTALKIEPKNKGAMILLARANYGKGSFDLAAKYSQDVLDVDKTNTAALQLMSAVNLKKAFSATTQGSAEEARTALGDALKAAAKSSREITEASIDKLTLKPTPGELVPWSDSMLRARRYVLVATATATPFESNPKNNDIAARHLFALLRSGQNSDAVAASERLKRFGSPDGYTYALMAVAYQSVGDVANSMAAEKNAVLAAPDNLGVQYASAYLALIRSKSASFGQILDNIDKIDPSGPIVNSYMSTRLYDLGDYSGAQDRFQTAIMADPGSPDVLIGRGRQIVSGALDVKPLGKDATDDEKTRAADLLKDRLATAQVFFEAAIQAKPDNAEALTGLALVHALSGHADEALAYGQAAAAAGKFYASAQLAHAVGLRQKNRLADSQRALDAAAKLDPRTRGRSTDASVIWRTFSMYGRTAYLPAPGEVR